MKSNIRRILLSVIVVYSCIAQAKASGMTAEELQIWNDPKFKQRFMESYIAQTDVEPRVTAEERSQLEKVLELIAKEKIDEAITRLQKANTKASSAVVDFMLGNIFFQHDRLEEAAASYLAAVEKYPRFLRAWKNMGLIYIRQGNFQQAIGPLTRTIELGQNDAISYGLLGYAYSSVGDDLAGESAYRMAVLLDPSTLDWKMGLARCLFKQEKYHDAVALCRRLSAAYPERADMWLLQANAYIGMEKPLKAAEVYEILEALGKSTPDSLNMLGDIYVNQELYAMAVQAYTRSMQMLQAGNVDRAVRAARVLAARGAFAETESLVNAITDICAHMLDDPQKKELLKIRARLALAVDSGEQEMRVLEEIIALDPLDGEALILLGQSYARAGDPEMAVFYYERAAAIEAFEADAKVRHAQLLVGRGKYAEALPLLRRAQTLKPRTSIQEYLEQVERVARAQ